MAPSAGDVRAYHEVIVRLSKLFSLGSFLPVISECRFKRLRAPLTKRPPPSAQQEEDSQPLETPEETATTAPVGILCVVLLILAELSWCYELFLPVASRKKSAEPKAGGLIPALRQGIKNSTNVGSQGGWQKVGSKRKPTAAPQGFMVQAITVLNTIMATGDAFSAVHGLAILAALLSTFGYVVYNTIPSGKGSLQSSANSVFVGLFVALPVSCFCFCNVELLGKAWKAFVGDKLGSAVFLPLRVLALIFAHPPLEENDTAQLSTPGMFSALQAASLSSYLSAEIASGSFGVAIQMLLQRQSVTNLFDSVLTSCALPIFIGLLWLTLTHLQRRPGCFLICMILTICASPVAISWAWPKVAEFLQLEPAGKVGPEPLLQAITVVYCLVLALICFSGGGIGLGITVMLLQGFLKIHGLESFGLTLPE